MQMSQFRTTKATAEQECTVTMVDVLTAEDIFRRRVITPQNMVFLCTHRTTCTKFKLLGLPRNIKFYNGFLFNVL